MSPCKFFIHVQRILLKSLARDKVTEVKHVSVWKFMLRWAVSCSQLKARIKMISRYEVESSYILTVPSRKVAF